MAIRINLRLTPESVAISEARHALDRLADVLPPGKLDDVRLAVSELVTNSVLHAGLSPDDQIRLSVDASAVSVCGKLCDPGPGFLKPSRLGPRPDFSGGWGLPILDRISDRWDLDMDTYACVW